MKGKVKFFNESKGYGFIKIDGSNEEVFVHITGLIDEIRTDDSVSFDVVEGKRMIQGKKGLNAINVKLA
ncbi:MAG: cold shock domain-containing protein [Bacteroidetes bacterium]|nr:MAG: cold shock domain-containing protein [Bacteroidota bacterium]